MSAFIGDAELPPRGLRHIHFDDFALIINGYFGQIKIKER
jgi:hypothetical protein